MERCALCKRTIDLSQPDRPAKELNALVGSLMENLGPARIRRDKLPNFGHFWTSLNGLLFVPNLERGDCHWMSRETKQSSWWNPFSRDNNNGDDYSEVENGEQGGEILQNRPGTWFTPWNEILCIQQTSRGVRIDLLNQNELFIKPYFDVSDLHSRWKSLQTQPVEVSAK